MVDPTGAKSELSRWFQTTIQHFTWFYIVRNPVMFTFIVWVAYRYGHIKYQVGAQRRRARIL
jgi:choline-glycine betaine transporter